MTSAMRNRTLGAARGVGGLTLPTRARQGVNLRVGPSIALKRQLRVDLDVLGGWLTATREQVGFVQIGAFDGTTNDPLHDLIRQFGWRGVLVEPQPEPFARLKEAYSDVEGIVLVNAAVAEERGTMTLWRLANPQPEDPWWLGQAASFDREHLLTHIEPLGDRPDLLERVVGEEVEAVTLADVFQQSPVPVDVLQIDAEGFDGRIVEMLDAVAVLPTIVRFEHRNLSTADHARAVEFLGDRAYQFVLNADDTVAVRHEPARGSTATH